MSQRGEVRNSPRVREDTGRSRWTDAFLFIFFLVVLLSVNVTLPLPLLSPLPASITTSQFDTSEIPLGNDETGHLLPVPQPSFTRCMVDELSDGLDEGE